MVKQIKIVFYHISLGGAGAAPDLGAALPFGSREVVLALQVQPKLRRCAENLRQAKRGIRADRPIAVEVHRASRSQFSRGRSSIRANSRSLLVTMV